MNDPSPREDELRELLTDAVSDVEPRPALTRIQNKTKVSPMKTSRTWILAAAGAVAATVVTVTAVTLVASDDDSPGEAGSPSATTSQEPSEAALPEGDEDADDGDSDSVGGTTTAAVYYVGETPRGPRLFREFHRVASSPDAIGTAVAESLTVAPLDPDYYTPWRGLAPTLVEATYDGSQVIIDLAPDPALRNRPADLTAEQARMALEQLMFTAHAAIGEGNQIPVRFLLGGEPTDRLLGVPTSEPLAAGNAMEVQSTVWVISPQDGDEVGSTFTVEGRGAFFEANVSWQLLQGGTVVEDGFATAEECCTLAPFSFEVRGVEPGDYVLRVYDADVSGGEGPGEAEDTKQISVR